MKQLKISQNEFILVDDEDFDRVSLYRWGCYFTNGGSSKSISSSGPTCGQHSVHIANFIMQNYGVIYDHEDRNQSNNQKNNLRIANHQQNAYNRNKPNRFEGCTSKFKGVSLSNNKRQSSDSWRARITVNGKKVPLGSFVTEVEAAQAYNKAAIHFFKEFAVLNKFD
jgi:hypothetical protein